MQRVTPPNRACDSPKSWSACSCRRKVEWADWSSADGGAIALLPKYGATARLFELRSPTSSKSPESAEERRRIWDEPVNSVYIPVKEMLANAPGFRSLYSRRSIHFEEIYADILDRAFLPPLLGAPEVARRGLLRKLRTVLEGNVTASNDEFFLRSRQGILEFTLLAEGLRKLGLLWLLIQNGTLLRGSVLFWDEPETNLNPRLFGPVVEILLELQRQGVQIFLATHDYLILKQLELQTTDKDQVAYHALYRDETGEVVCKSTESYLDIEPNAIAEAFSDVYDLEIQRSLGKRK